MVSRNFTFILGGARSGKSIHAEHLARDSGMPVSYVATAPVSDDAEFAARIALHRERRPAHWTLHETPIDLAHTLDSISGDGQCVLIDCLTLWLTNLLCPADGTGPRTDADTQIQAFLAACQRARGTVIVVSNEIGMGVIPLGAATRQYVDTLGQLNQQVAALADQVLLVAAGLPLVLKAPTA